MDNKSTTTDSLQQEAISMLSLLDDHDQAKVLDYIESLARFSKNELSGSRISNAPN